MTRTRHPPEGAETQEYEHLKAVVYLFNGKGGLPAAIAYSGRRSRPDFHIQQTEHVIVRLGPRVVSGRFERDLDPDSCSEGRRIGAGPCNDVIANGSNRDQLNVHGLHGE